MKYTNYIINGHLAIDSIVSNKWYFKHLTIIIGLCTAIFGLIILTGFLLIALIIDSSRYAKLRYYHYAKVYNNYLYINSILSSLSVPMRNRYKYHVLLNTTKS